MKKLIVTVLAAALTLTACGGSDSASSTLRVGTLSDAPPNIYLSGGNYTGFDNELLKAIAAKQNLSWSSPPPTSPRCSGRWRRAATTSPVRRSRRPTSARRRSTSPRPTTSRR